MFVFTYIIYESFLIIIIIIIILTDMPNIGKEIEKGIKFKAKMFFLSEFLG